MAIFESPDFRSAKMQKSYKPVICVNINGRDLFWASRYIDVSAECFDPTNWTNAGEDDYVDRLLQIAGISINVDRFGGLASTGEATITISNISDYLDTWAYTTPLIGQDMSLYIYFDDVGGAWDSLDRINIFTGIVSDFQITNNNQEAVITATHYSILYDRNLLPLHRSDFIEVSGTWFDRYPILNNFNIGEPLPICIGEKNHYGLGSSTEADHQADNIQNLHPAVYIGSTFTPHIGGWRAAIYRLAPHMIKSVSAVWMKDKKTGRMVKVKSDHWKIIMNNDREGCVLGIKQWSLTEIYDYLFPTEESDAAGGVFAIPAWADPEFSADHNKNTDAELNFDPGTDPAWAPTPGGEPFDLTINTATDTFSGGLPETISGLVQRGTNAASVAGANQIINCIASWDSMGTYSGPGSQTITLQFDLADSDIVDADIQEVKVFAKRRLHIDAAFQITANVYTVFKEVRRYVPAEFISSPQDFEVYIEGEGLPFKTWINTRAGHVDNNAAAIKVATRAGQISTSGASHRVRDGVTNFGTAGVVAGDILRLLAGGNIGHYVIDEVLAGTNGVKLFSKAIGAPGAISYQVYTGAVIENGASMVEGIARDVVGISNIATSKFNSASNGVGNVDFSIVEQIEINEFLDRCGKDLFAFLWWSNKNELAMAQGDQTGLTFTHSTSATVPNDPDIYTDENVVDPLDSLRWRYHPIYNVQLKRTAASDFLNILNRKYYKNYAYNQYNIADIENTSLAASSARFGMEREGSQDFDLISNVAQISTDIINQRRSFRWICDFETNLDALHLEIGDVINIRSFGTKMLMKDTGATSYDKWRWRVLAIDYDLIRDTGHARITAVDIFVDGIADF